MNLTFFLWICAIIGVIYIDPQYISTINMGIQIYIGCMLLYIFNPWSKKKRINKEEKDMIYIAGSLLIISAGGIELFKRFILS